MLHNRPSSILPPIAVLLTLLAAACVPLRSTLGRPPTAAELSRLWQPPADNARRDVLHGEGGADSAPDPDVVYRTTEIKKGGYSPKMEVVDPSGKKWDVKLGPEAQSEVTASRILWLLGYRQPPGFCLLNWKLQHDDGRVQKMGPGRFRPHLEWIEGKGQWSWNQNPFIDSQPFRGLVVLMMILNSTDLKDDNNEIYEVRLQGGTRQQWYSVRDLGASLGETGWTGQRRNDIDFFEKEGFISGTSRDGHPQFEFHGRRPAMLAHVTVADVRWICERLSAVRNDEWRDAFKAGGYGEPTTSRYLAKIDEKIRQGLSLRAQAEGTR